MIHTISEQGSTPEQGYQIVFNSKLLATFKKEGHIERKLISVMNNTFSKISLNIISIVLKELRNTLGKRR